MNTESILGFIFVFFGEVAAAYFVGRLLFGKEKVSIGKALAFVAIIQLFHSSSSAATYHGITVEEYEIHRMFIILVWIFWAYCSENAGTLVTEIYEALTKTPKVKPPEPKEEPASNELYSVALPYEDGLFHYIYSDLSKSEAVHQATKQSQYTGCQGTPYVVFNERNQAIALCLDGVAIGFSKSPISGFHFFEGVSEEE